MTIRWRDKIFVAKIESTYGVDSSPVGANAMLATEISLSAMEGQDLPRNLDRGYLGGQPTIPVDLHSKIKFKVELQGSGTVGTPPAYSPLLRACGFAETIVANTSVTYNPISDGMESVTKHLWIGPTRYALKGSRGDCNLMLAASGIPYLEFDFTSLFTMPSDQTRITPNYSTFQKPTPVTNATTPVFTLDGTDFTMRNFTLKCGNDVQGRFLVGDEGIIITDRSELAEFQIVTTPLATWNPYQKAFDAASVDLQMVHGTTAGKIVTIDINNMQLQRPTGLTEAQGITEWPLRGVPLPVSGNDQFTLTFT